MDSARISIFEIFIPASLFSEYNHTHPSAICIGLNATILFKVLNIYDKHQVMSIEYENDADELFIHYTSETKANFDKHFEIPLIEIETEMLEIPDFESIADITMPSINFASVVSQLKIFADSVEIACSEEKILMNTSASENGKMSVEIKMDDLDVFAIQEGANINLCFSLNHLQNICMFHKISKNMEIRLAADYPMRIAYGLEDDAKMVFYLAPKINDD